MASFVGLSKSVIVSPTFTSFASLIPVMRYPTSPAKISGLGFCLRFRVPTSSAPYDLSVARNLIFWFFLIEPLITLKYVSIPLKGLYTESKISACRGFFGSPDGGGILSIIALKIFSTPSPVFALAGITSSAAHPSKSTMSSVTSCGFALGRSTLFKTGIISRSFSKAR